MHTVSIPDHIGLGDFVYRNRDFIPLMVEGRGCNLVDQNGLIYLDAEAANGTLGLGYRSDILITAFEKIKALPSLPSFLESPLRLQVAEKLANIFRVATGNDGRVCFELGGAQAIELAIKIALKNTNGTHFAVFEGCYHGRSLFTSHLSASNRYRISLDGPKVLRLPYPDFNNRFSSKAEDAISQFLPYLDFTLNNDAAGYKDVKFAALIIEPILNVGGMVVPEKAYLNHLVKEFRKKGALIIVDEIFTGFYRTGKEWGFQHFDFTPDIVVASKALSNGLVPVSCVWAKEPYLSLENFPPATHSITYANNPLNLAIVDTILDFYKNEKIEQKVHLLEKKMKESLTKTLSGNSLVKDIMVLGGLARIRLMKPMAEKIRNAALQLSTKNAVKGYSGLIIASTGMAPDVINIHPPFTISDDEVITLSHLLRESINSVVDANE